jgi:AcrR family transcriptional regulator
VGATRTKILAATRSILSTSDPSAVTMRAVAERVGVTATALYRHFPDKDALLAEVMQADARLISGYLFPALEEPDPEGRLRATIEGYLRFAHTEPTLYGALMQGEGAGAEGASPPLARQREGLYRFLLDRVREVVETTPSAAHPDEITRFLWTYLHGAATMPRLADRASPGVKTALRATWLLARGTAPAGS